MNKVMDQWLKTGTMKRTLNEKEKDREKVQRRDSAAVAIVEPLDAIRPSASLPQPEHENSTAKVKQNTIRRTYNLDFLGTGHEEDPKPHCVLWYESLANECMKPAKLQRYFENKHKEYMGKPIGFFERKRDKLKKQMKKEPSQFLFAGENALTTEASYDISLMMAKLGKSHSLGEKLVKPAAKHIAELLLGGKKAGDIVHKIPPSNDTVQRRIESMAQNVEDQLLTRIRQSQFFSLQLAESTDIGNEANLLSYVRYIYAGEVHDDFLFCRSLPTNTTGEAIFDSLNNFITQNDLDWTRCVGICTDGATAMTGKHRD